MVLTDDNFDMLSDRTFLTATGVSVVVLFLAPVFGPFQAFLKTTNLDIQQWLGCAAIALSIIAASEIRKAMSQ